MYYNNNSVLRIISRWPHKPTNITFGGHHPLWFSCMVFLYGFLWFIQVKPCEMPIFHVISISYGFIIETYGFPIWFPMDFPIEITSISASPAPGTRTSAAKRRCSTSWPRPPCSAATERARRRNSSRRGCAQKKGLGNDGSMKVTLW